MGKLLYFVFLINITNLFALQINEEKINNETEPAENPGDKYILVITDRFPEEDVLGFNNLRIIYDPLLEYRERYSTPDSLGSWHIYTNDLNCIINQDLKDLSLSVNGLKYADFYPLSKLEKLHWLNIYGYKSYDEPYVEIPDLRYIKNLKDLSFHWFKLGIPSGIKNKLPDIEKLTIASGSIYPIKELNELVSLKKLALSEVQFSLSSFTDFYKLSSLEEITIEAHGGDLDLEGVENLSSLRSLVLSNNYGRNRNIDRLLNLKALEKLELAIDYENNDIGFLENLVNLRELKLTNIDRRNSLKDRRDPYHIELDIFSIRGLMQLESLDLNVFKIKNSIIADTLPSLENVRFYQCDLEPDENQKITEKWEWAARLEDYDGW
jgi:hypothetical protein